MYQDYRVKTCTACETNVPSDHTCLKNWTASSQSMETDIIVKGFLESYEKYGLIYKYVVADADSSVYSSILAAVRYPERILVEKVDCVNHAVRGVNTKLYGLISNTAYPLADRDIIKKQINRYVKQLLITFLLLL